MERKPPVKISILEKDESEVSHCWKLCQLFSYILVVISGVATSLAMGNIQKMFKHECVLYADLAVSAAPNYTIVVTPHHASRWGALSHCSFCQFCPVASVIFAGVWGTIFVMCGRGGASSRNLPQPWRIIPPAILFNFIFLVLSCVSVGLTFGGFSAFCSSIFTQVQVESCEDLIGYTWDRYPDAMNFYDDIVIAQTGASVGLVGWFMGFVILLIRVITHADFRVVGSDRKSSSIATNCISTNSNQSSNNVYNNLSTMQQNGPRRGSTHVVEGRPLIATVQINHSPGHRQSPCDNKNKPTPQKTIAQV